MSWPAVACSGPPDCVASLDRQPGRSAPRVLPTTLNKPSNRSLFVAVGIRHRRRIARTWGGRFPAKGQNFLLRWRDAPAEYGPVKTIYNRFIRWSRTGVFNKIIANLAAKGGKPDQLMIDATHLKAHRTAASLLKRGSTPTYRTYQRRPDLQAPCRL